MNAGLVLMGLMTVCSVILYLIIRTDKGRKWLMGEH